MKRLVTAFIIGTLLLATAAASERSVGFTFGAELRYANTLDDMDEQREAKWNVILEHYPVMAEMGLQWENPLAGAIVDTAFIAGIRAGSAGIAETEAPDRLSHYRLTTVPFGAFTRFEAGFLYLDLGAGGHRWSVDYDVNGEDMDESGFGLSASVSAGFRAVLFRRLTLRTAANVTYYGIADIGTGLPANTLTAGLVCGVNFRL